MENHTVIQLKAITKERRVRCYYKLKGGVDTRLGSGKINRTKKKQVKYLRSRFRMIPLQFYNQHIGGHQMSQRKINKI